MRRIKHWNGSRLNTLSLTPFYPIQVGEASFTACLEECLAYRRPCA